MCNCNVLKSKNNKKILKHEKKCIKTCITKCIKKLNKFNNISKIYTIL